MSVTAVTVPQAHVTISAFDVHLWSKPFDPAVFNPKIHFLWSACEYRKMREAGEKIELGNLVLFPLKHELSPKRNHFWPRYKVAIENMPADSQTPLGDSRDFLWPLCCRPRNFRLTFAEAEKPSDVQAAIWLWPFGWSSTVEFDIASPLSLVELQNLGAQLRANAPGPFVLDDQPLALAGVFQRLANMVRQDAANPGKTLNDVTHLQRHVVYSFQLLKGSKVPANAAGWTAANQLRMLGALRGNKVQLGQLLNAGILFTTLGDRNFAVTDFAEGTLLVLQHWKDRPGTKRETNHCLFANVRTFSVVHFALHRFILYAKDRPALASAVENAKIMLSSLPEEYRNGLALNFKKYHSPPG